MEPKQLVETFADVVCHVVSESDRPAKSLHKCGSCDKTLQWPLPEDGCWASPMACPKCGRWYFSQCRNETQLVIQRDRLTGDQEPESANDPAHALSKLIREAPTQADRRREPRHLVELEITIVPLSDLARPMGECHKAAVTNLSYIGAELKSAKNIESEFLLLDFSNLGLEGVQLIAQVRWRVLDCGHYRLGCEFVNDIGAPLPVADKE
ncbi:MAG: PilZ domain-containing protein [Planctomycetales bacterium]|nr:PilZ domain-containing protein [Planctomycetales bacterium]